MSEKKKTYTTNYFNAFIEISDDCPATKGEIPPINDKAKSVARQQYEKLIENPYKFTSDEALFCIYAKRKELDNSEIPIEKEIFFSKGQACFRASPLAKRYGWGIHCNENGQIAIYGCETAEYKQFSQSGNLKKLKAMKSSK